MLDIKQQVGDYLVHVVQRVDLDDVTERRFGLEPVRPIEPREVAPTRWRWAYGLAAAVIVLAIAGVMLWLSGSTGESDVVDPPDQPPVTETTVREPTETTVAEDDATETNVESVPVVRTVVGSFGEAIPPSLFAADRIVAADGAVWVGSQDSGESPPTGALYRIDPAASEITDRIPMAGGVADMLVEGDVLWVLTGAGELHRVDISSGQITGTLTIDCDIDDCFWYGNSDLLASGGEIWLTSVNNIGDLGQWRIDPATLAIEVVPDEGGVRYDLNDGGSADGVAVDAIDPGGEMWLGEANGLLWSLRSHDGWIMGLNPQSGARVAYEMHTLAGVDAHESWATLAGDDIWLVPCCSTRVVRFDTATREISTVAFGGGWHASVDEGALWIAAQDHIERLDMMTMTVTDSLVVEGLEPLSVVTDEFGSIWVSGESVVVRIDPQSRRVSDVVEVGSGGQLLAVSGAIWIAGEDGTVSRIDQG